MTITLLSDSATNWFKYKQLILDAKNSILLAIWYELDFDSSKCIHEIEQILNQKIKQGLNITIIYINNDPHNKSDHIKTKTFVRDIGKAGATIIKINELDNTTDSCRKILVVDDNQCIIDNYNSYKPHNKPIITNASLHIKCDIYVVDSKIASLISQTLLKNVAHDCNSNHTHYVKSFPIPTWTNFLNNRTHTTDDKHADLINGATESVVLVNCTILHRPAIKQAIIDALFRDVTVVIYANGISQGTSEIDPAKIFPESVLSNPNFKFFENISPYVLHTKYAVFDQKIICTKSFIFNAKSYVKQAKVLYVRENVILAKELLLKTYKMQKKYFGNRKTFNLENNSGIGFPHLELMIISTIMHLLAN
jgi:phosphatidylserine/phosphatidylglycerophosphate/cardiolipin synthase-like enzyme